MFLKHFIWLLVLSSAAVVLMDQAVSQAPLLELLPFLPFLIGSGAIFISIFLNRFQPILILATLMLLNLAVFYYRPTGADLTTLTLFPLVSLLFPFNLLLWSWLPENGLHKKGYVIFQLGLLSAEVFAIYGMMAYIPLAWWQWVSMPFEGNIHQITLPALVAFILVGGALLFRTALVRQAKVLDLALLFVLVVVAIALDHVHQPAIIYWLSSFAALMILFALVFDAHHLAYTDQLTGLSGRRALMETFMGLGRRYSIAMMDIDHFKSFNDRYGHEVGDQVLREVADALRQISVGRVFRYGGEEFAVVFKNKTPEDVVGAIETVREKIADLTLQVKQKKRLTKTQVTVSFGVAQKTPDLKLPEAVMKAADEALYQAKKAGRNQTVVYRQPTKKPPKTLKN